MATILKLEEVIQRTGKKRSTIQADSKTGAFPAPIKTGIKSVGWIESEIDEWIAARIKTRDERK